MPLISPRRAAALLAGLALALASGRADAQPLAPRRTLTLPTPGCPAPAPRAPAGAARDVAAARRLVTQGREAALVGDRAEARDAFRRAAALDPHDEQIAYELGRAHEELADSASAVREYCRHLALAPQGGQAADVRARLARLTPPAAAAGARRAQSSFAAALAAYDRGRAADAARGFDEVLRLVPAAAEALHGRALARIALGRRAEAARDLEAYLAAAPAADDRVAVLRAIDALRRPIPEPSRALARGLTAPGLGQFYTGRPGLGVAAAALTAAAAGAAAFERTTSRDRTFLDAFGRPYTQAVRVAERPYLVPGAAAAAGVWLAAAIEARLHAGRVAARAAAPGSLGARRLSVAPALGADGASGVQLRAWF